MLVRRSTAAQAERMHVVYPCRTVLLAVDARGRRALLQLHRRDGLQLSHVYSQGRLN